MSEVDKNTPQGNIGYNSDFFTEIVKGNVRGHRFMNALGERESMAVVAAGEDIWRGNELTPAPTSTTKVPTPAEAGEQMSVVSENAADNAVIIYTSITTNGTLTTIEDTGQDFLAGNIVVVGDIVFLDDLLKIGIITNVTSTILTCSLGFGGSTPGVGENYRIIDRSASGTGVIVADIEALDGDGNEVEIPITLNGITAVPLPNSAISFVNDFHSLVLGSGGVAAGHLKILKTSTVGLVYNMIQAGTNKSVVPHRKIPAGHILVMKGWHAEEAKSKRVNIRIRSTDHEEGLITGVFHFKDVVELAGAASGPLPLFHRAPAMSIIKVTGWGDAVGAEASVGWHGILVKIDG